MAIEDHYVGIIKTDRRLRHDRFTISVSQPNIVEDMKTLPCTSTVLTKRFFVFEQRTAIAVWKHVHSRLWTTSERSRAGRRVFEVSSCRSVGLSSVEVDQLIRLGTGPSPLERSWRSALVNGRCNVVVRCHLHDTAGNLW